MIINNYRHIFHERSGPTFKKKQMYTNLDISKWNGYILCNNNKNQIEALHQNEFNQIRSLYQQTKRKHGDFSFSKR